MDSKSILKAAKEKTAQLKTDRGEKLRTIEATYDLVTPLFMGGRDGKICRPQAQGFIGALAFWWRAMAWSRVWKACAVSDNGGSSDEAEKKQCVLKKIREQERRIFGAAVETDKDGNTQYGQGIFTVTRFEVMGFPNKLSVSSVHRREKEPRDGWRRDRRNAGCPACNHTPAGYAEYERPSRSNNYHWSKTGSGVTYLCGQGLLPSKKQEIYTLDDETSTRDAIDENGMASWVYPTCYVPEDNSSILVRLLVTRQAKEEDIATLIEALKALGIFGGIGAKTSRALGSLSIRELKVFGKPQDIPSNIEELNEAIKGILPANDPRKPVPQAPYPAFSSWAQKLSADKEVRRGSIAVALPCKDQNTASHALNYLGHRFQLFRSIGQTVGATHRIGGEVVDDRAQTDPIRLDCDWAMNPNQTNAPKKFYRAEFGLPISFFKWRGPSAAVNLFRERPSSDDGSPYEERRSPSPIRFHLHKFSKNNLAYVLTFFDHKQIPEHDKFVVCATHSNFSEPRKWKKVGNIGCFGKLPRNFIIELSNALTSGGNGQ